jgi:hypothetical protein
MKKYRVTYLLVERNFDFENPKDCKSGEQNRTKSRPLFMEIETQFSFGFYLVFVFSMTSAINYTTTTLKSSEISTVFL